jgi:glutathione S-transferase
MPARLITIGPSHYCEKARWALDYGRIQFAEDAHLPVLHSLYTRVAGGRSVPILVHDGISYNDSTRILEFVHAHAPSAALYDAAGEALALEEHFDEHIGPWVRRLAYCYLADHPAVLRAVFWPFASRTEKAILRVGATGLAAALKRVFRTSESAAQRGHASLMKEFDSVATKLQSESLTSDSAYLVGARFTAADLSFAALIQPLLLLAGRKEVVRGRVAQEAFRPPENFIRAFAPFAEHPAGAYALRMYETHRSLPAEPALT